MDGMEQKLNSILSNPEMMSQIMAMAQSLGGAAGNPPPKDPPAKQQEPPPPQIPTLPNDLDLSMLQKMQGFAQNSSIDSHQQALLRALSPYLAGERIRKLEKAMRAAKLASVASGFLGSQGLSLFSGR